MTKVQAGDWVCPNNDGSLIWRFTRYEEDGSLAEEDGTPIKGVFWAASYIRAEAWSEETLDDWSLWTAWRELLPTRDAAIAAMQEHSAAERPREPLGD